MTPDCRLTLSEWIRLLARQLLGLGCPLIGRLAAGCTGGRIHHLMEAPMPLLLIVLLVLLLAGGGGFYWGGPAIGGSTVGLILLIAIIIALTGGFRSRV